jgi:WD40 repeat protein
MLVLALDFDLNGMLASGSEDNTIKRWDNNSGVLLRTLEGHGFWVCNAQLVWFDKLNPIVIFELYILAYPLIKPLVVFKNKKKLKIKSSSF